MYSVRFVPIIENGGESFNHMEDILNRRSQNQELVHVLKTTRFCWCDLDALASINRGVMYPFYVIEVEVEGWEGDDPRNKELISHVSSSFLCTTNYSNSGRLIYNIIYC